RRASSRLPCRRWNWKRWTGRPRTHTSRPAETASGAVALARRAARQPGAPRAASGAWAPSAARPARRPGRTAPASALPRQSSTSQLSWKSCPFSELERRAYGEPELVLLLGLEVVVQHVATLRVHREDQPERNVEHRHEEPDLGARRRLERAGRPDGVDPRRQIQVEPAYSV